MLKLKDSTWILAQSKKERLFIERNLFYNGQAIQEGRLNGKRKDGAQCEQKVAGDRNRCNEKCCKRHVCFCTQP